MREVVDAPFLGLIQSRIGRDSEPPQLLEDIS